MTDGLPDLLPTLDAAECRRLAPLFDPRVPNHPCLLAVLHDHAPGRAVVDDAAEPTRALVRSDYGFTFASRAADQHFLERAIAQERTERPVLLVWSEAEERRLAVPPSHLDVTCRVEYRAREGALKTTLLPAGYSYQQMDAELLARCLWKGEVVRACGTTERFLDEGLGFCVVWGEDIASESYAVFRGDGVFEIGVVTARAHRGLGLAVHACARLIEACEAEGMGTYWSCNRDNVASGRVAEKLGFTDRRAYRFHLY